MDCPKCGSKHDKTRRFCTVCGAPLGMVCERCGSPNGNEDSYCGTCGLPLLDADSGRFHGGPRQGNIPRQYDAAEIVSLLTLRMAVENEKDASQSYTQKDIDNLFD